MTAGSQLSNLQLLKEVSRSFYLTLRVLPGRLRHPVGLAYLLARTSDTIADTDLVPLAHRLEALQNFRNQTLAQSPEPLNLSRMAQHQGSPAEQRLLTQADRLLTALNDLPAADQERLRELLTIIISGQILDLERFAHAGPDRVVALETDAELDDYTYRVAGCVGEFWTRMSRAHLFPNAALDDDFLLRSGVRFGKGLQLVNILRDLPVDLRQGRCYLSFGRLAKVELKPDDLLNPDHEPRLRPVYHAYLDEAEAHLAAGWAYTRALPWRSMRLRLACAWPILIGAHTLRKLRSSNVLNPEGRIRLSRREVRHWMLHSLLRYPCPAAWDRLFLSARSGSPGNAIASPKRFK
jgi:farnesyl-diphosphate farnesyltransferase